MTRQPTADQLYKSAFFFVGITKKTSILIPVLILIAGLSVRAQNTSYYLSLEGDDNADGLSPASAWQSIDKLNDTDFKPGDSILFRAGDIFTGNLQLGEEDGNDPENILGISSYGEGRATLNAVNGFGIVLNNTEGISIDNLHITGSGMETNSRSGIYLVNTLDSDFKFSTIEIREIEIEGFGVNGITITGFIGNSGFRDILIEDTIIHNCLDGGISVTGEFSTEKTGYAHANITVRNTQVYDIPGTDKEYHSGSGIMISDVQDSVIENCTVFNCGYNNTQCGGPVGIWYFDADRAVIQYCEAYEIKAGTGCDGGGFDLDGGVTNSVMQYNYSHDNDGSGFLIGQFIDARRMYNNTIRYNISENDARTNGGGIYLFNLQPDNPPERISIYHNTVYMSNSAGNPDLAAAGALDNRPVGPGIEFINNLFYTSGNTPFVNIPQGFQVSFINNLYYSEDQSAWDYQGTTYNSLAAFRGSGNEIMGTEPVGYSIDPMLNNPGQGGTIGFKNDLSTLPAYQLAHRSPALNVAIPIEENDSPTDFFGTNSLLGPLPDIGAFELDDKIPPEITLEGANPFTLEAGTPFEDPGAYTDDGSEVILSTDDLQPVVGEYEVIYSSTDVYGNYAEITRTIDVVDTRAPVIACDEMYLELNNEGKAEVTDEFLRAHITDPSEYTIEFEFVSYSCESVGVNPVMVKATDIYGNSSTCTASIEVVDLIPPELFTTAEELPLELFVAEKEEIVLPDLIPMIRATDNCSAFSDLIITQSPEPGRSLRRGDYEWVFTIEDLSGNITTLTVPFNIVEGVPDQGGLFIYPNPVSDMVRYNKDVVRTTIYDLKGTRVFETYDPRFDISFLQKGLYMFEVVTPEGTFHKKVVKD